MFDSHAHYEDRRFDIDRESLLNDLFASNVTAIVNIGTNKELSFQSKALAEKYRSIYFTAGIHPCYAEEYEECEKWILPLIYHEKCVAIGEIGLDYHYDTPSKEVQKTAFRKQLEIAEKHNIPVSIHDRDAHADCLDILDEFPDVKGIFHSFSGSAEMAKSLVKKGWYISFSGVITFKNAEKPKQAASVVPIDRILCETDCPYLTPHPFRGERNDSSFMRHTLQSIADLKQISFEEAERITSENALRAYNIM